MNTVMLSLWRNDVSTGLMARTQHLLSKGCTRWLWAVGDSTDTTEIVLRSIAQHSRQEVEVVCCNTGILGDDPNTRLLRLSATVNQAFDYVRPSDDMLVLHESDLISPPDVVERLLVIPADVTAGWVTLGHSETFYDTYAYRADGRMFSNYPPYHPRYRFTECFEVDCVGSVWRAPAADFVSGIRAERFAVIDIMRQLKARGRRVMVDPTLHIVQPREWWISRSHGDG